MVTIRPVRPENLAAFADRYNEGLGRDRTVETFRRWREEHPELLLAARADGEVVGVATGRPYAEGTVELDGIAVETARRRDGVGSRLLDEFEERAAAAGYERVSLGSAGGYVDEFYVANGYEPTSILVRWDADEGPPFDRPLSLPVVEETVEDGTGTLYVDVDEHDPAFLESVRRVTGDEEAIYVMEKRLAEEG